MLLLNTALTVRASQAGSHAGKGWETFTDRIVDIVDRYGGASLGEKTGRGRGIVFMAWGAWAQKRVAKVDKVRVPRSVLPRHLPAGVRGARVCLVGGSLLTDCLSLHSIAHLHRGAAEIEEAPGAGECGEY